jgi:hypothetical protein
MEHAAFLKTSVSLAYLIIQLLCTEGKLKVSIVSGNLLCMHLKINQFVFYKVYRKKLAPYAQELLSATNNFSYVSTKEKSNMTMKNV